MTETMGPGVRARRARLGGILLGVLAAVAPARADHDPQHRTIIHLGAETPLEGDAGTAVYAFLYWNRPDFPDKDHYFRIILAPTFLQAEWFRDKWPTQGQAFGLGFGGGWRPYDYEQITRGERKEGESFWGHGGELLLGYFPNVKIADVFPIEWQLRLMPRYVLYERSEDGDPRFRLPEDTLLVRGLAGFRAGGIPPELFPEIALEVSGWYEAMWRLEDRPYGFPEQPLELSELTHRFYGRLNGTGSVGPLKIMAGVSLGTLLTPDRLSSFRIGGALRFRSGFPLMLHGYYQNEVYARQFLLVNSAFWFPIWPGSEILQLRFNFDYARVDYLKGLRLPQRGLRGAGVDLLITVTPKIRAAVGYGYGFDAPRKGGLGGHEVLTVLEVGF